MDGIERLEWDSEQLSLNVARLIKPRIPRQELQIILNHLAKAGVKLVYWASDSECSESQYAAESLNGFLADEKITYLFDLKKLNPNVSLPMDYSISEYEDIKPSIELIELAYLSGKYSRFQQDPCFSSKQFQTIYRTWIENSVNKQIAKKNFVIKIEGYLAGMITLGEKQGNGDIGLLAIHEQYQGKKLGKALVTAAQHYFYSHYQYCQVVTQKINIPACRLYESCDFSIKKVENFYHFWL
ncbi:MAG: dTDP-fucosamine acetyltransferase [Legionellaceae bacterium]